MKYPINFKILERCYEDWLYQAASTMINGMQVIYCRVNDKGDIRECIETYSGPNYIPNSSGRSYSRHYPIDKIPNVHKTTLSLLKGFLIQELGDKIIKI